MYNNIMMMTFLRRNNIIILSLIPIPSKDIINIMCKSKIVRTICIVC